MADDRIRRGAAAAERAAVASARAAGTAGRVVAGATRRSATWVRGWTHGKGAGSTGLGAMVELHGVNSAADALFAVSLAGTLFFQVPTDQARGRVALYLLVTMAPFAVVAPLVGPALDRFRHGRRTALALTMVVRGVLAFEVARTLGTRDAFALYPAAFAVLVLSRGYSLSRAAVMPRLRPEGITLVQANARLSLAGLVTAAVAAPLGAGIAGLAGHAWTLRAAAAVYVLGAALALRLPPRIDSRAGEHALSRRRIRDVPRGLGPQVTGVLRSAAALRMLSGFLLLFVAFLVRQHPLNGLRGTVAVGVLAVAVAAGGLAGTGIGARLGKAHPEGIVTVAVAVAFVCSVLTAWRFGLATALILAFVAAAGQSLSKLALDAVVQREVAEDVRTSAFGRTETLLQLAWVIGGAVGIVLPLSGTWGFAIASGLLVFTLFAAVRFQRDQRRRASRAAATAEPRPGVAAR